MLKKFSITIGTFFLIMLVMGLILPNEYEIKRSVLINAKPEAIHNFVEDLDQWPQWTPWNAENSKIKITPGAIHKGTGASQRWEGKSGVGELKITRSAPDYGIDYVLDMNADSLNTRGSITYQPEGDQTKVTWTTEGQFTLPVIGPYIAMAMDGTAGPMFETSLSKLKKLVEVKTHQKQT